MSQITQQQLLALAQQLGGLAAIFNPGSAAAIGGLVQVGTQLFALLQQIRANDPAMWEAVRTDFTAALAEFEAAAPKQKKG